jgi:hypothetical protein
MVAISFESFVICPSSLFNIFILFFFTRPAAFLWKNFVFLSPSLSHEMRDHCRHIISSQYRSSSNLFLNLSASSWLFMWFFAHNSYIFILIFSISFVTAPNFSKLHFFKQDIVVLNLFATSPRSCIDNPFDHARHISSGRERSPFLT